MNSAQYPSDFFFRKDDSHNRRISKPSFNSIGGWDLSGLVLKSEIACTYLAEGRKSGRAVFLTNLIPSVAFEHDSKELDVFLKTARYFKNSKGIRFVPRAVIKNFSSQVRGYTSYPRHSEGVFSVTYQCSGCSREINFETIDRAAAGLTAVCECGNRFELKHYDLRVPALVQKYEDHLTLKQIFHQAHATNATVPDGIFCYLIFSVAKLFRLVLDQELPLLISSNVILITASGRIRFICLPTLSCSKSLVKKDVPSIIGRFFEAYCHLVPEVSRELSRFMTLPNLKTMAALKYRSKTVSKNDLKLFLQYIKTHRDSSAVTNIHMDVAKNSLRISLTSTLNPFDITLHPGKVNAQKMEHLSLMETKRISSQRKMKTWERIVSSEKVPDEMLAAILFHLKKTRAWQKIVCVVAAAFVGLIATYVAVVFNKETQPAVFYASTTGLISTQDSKKANLIAESIPDELSQKLEETFATVKLQVQPDGTVKQIKWIFASEQQKNVYERNLFKLRFEPAVEHGRSMSNWVAFQLPIKRQRK